LHLRKLATILLLTVFCNSLFYYGYFSFSLLKAKLAARVALAKISPQGSSGILKVPAGELQRDESDEVWYNNELYDVAERDRINDTVYVFLLRDEEEQHVLTLNENYFREDGGLLPAGGHQIMTIKRVPAVTDSENMQSGRFMLLWHDGPIRLPVAYNTYLPAAVWAEIPSPPPKQA
jgi:hypothetical protein